jgi:hypothetical protein
VGKTAVSRSPRRKLAGSAHVDVLALSAPELLRFIVETPKVWAVLVRCSRCGYQALDLGPPRTEPLSCMNCREGICELLDGRWWKTAASRVRRACRQDRTLLPAVKAEWQARHGDVPLPSFAEPFVWLNAAWKMTAMRGRSFDARRHYELAHLVDRLTSAGVSMNKISMILSTHDRVVRQQVYDALPARVPRWLGEHFRVGLKDLPFVSTKEELLRSVRWAHRQWTKPRTRLRGERVRARARSDKRRNPRPV